MLLKQGERNVSICDYQKEKQCAFTPLTKYFSFKEIFPSTNAAGHILFHTAFLSSCQAELSFSDWRQLTLHSEKEYAGILEGWTISPEPDLQTWAS